ncbi:MAG: pantoate--beta-alanine ligase [Halobacteriovoraceae bacterium]|nr:pantoate--beta-alanine ligase [Halobacteriovoraceae bacterium]|tara:strand:+ start:4771 stop:5607 length:837 start_codon:yes stop_codon:yes gene_type:complete
MVTVIHSSHELQNLNQDYKGKIGLVPTMGNLHQGHLNLLKASLEECSRSIVSIFVNPTQFGKGEDYNAYPRTLESDIKKIESLGEDVFIFAPAVNEIYGDSVETDFSAGEVGQMLEGNIRPGHFDGVLTIVHKLFEMASPNRAYFGKKDYQQWRLIEWHAREYFPNLAIVPVGIERETSGLAMSSRNNYLTESQKEEALELYRSLSQIEKILIVDKDLRSALEFIQSKLSDDDRFNYLSIRKQSDLTPPLDLSEPLVILGNLQVGSTRLLDNIEVAVE